MAAKQPGLCGSLMLNQSRIPCRMYFTNSLYGCCWWAASLADNLLQWARNWAVREAVKPGGGLSGDNRQLWLAGQVCTCTGAPQVTVDDVNACPTWKYLAA